MDIFASAAELGKNNRSFVIATITDISGSVPGKIGFKILVTDDGTTTGTVGGGAIEKHVIEESLKRMTTSESGSRSYILSESARETKDITVIPMSCSGKLTVYYEVHGKKPTVYIFGGGHVGQTLSYFLKPLPYYIIMIDNREEFANHEKNPHVHQIIYKDYQEYASTFNPQPDSFVVILTHGHKYDEKILNLLSKRKITLAYIGIIASKTKAAGILKRLEKDNKNADLSIIHSPVGLNIGGSTAAEIALSIAAELQSVYYSINV